ncbi:unnamed protein product [Amoebophrya sp. A25]|nr:unnamed protein product [Amoebophrya sp. A25]|eukprot:GSA25T00018176001.1
MLGKSPLDSTDDEVRGETSALIEPRKWRRKGKRDIVLPGRVVTERVQAKRGVMFWLRMGFAFVVVLWLLTASLWSRNTMYAELVGYWSSIVDGTFFLSLTEEWSSFDGSYFLQFFFLYGLHPYDGEAVPDVVNDTVTTGEGLAAQFLEKVAEKTELSHQSGGAREDEVVAVLAADQPLKTRVYEPATLQLKRKIPEEGKQGASEKFREVNECLNQHADQLGLRAWELEAGSKKDAMKDGQETDNTRNPWESIFDAENQCLLKAYQAQTEKGEHKMKSEPSTERPGVRMPREEAVEHYEVQLLKSGWGTASVAAVDLSVLDFPRRSSQPSGEDKVPKDGESKVQTMAGRLWILWHMARLERGVTDASLPINNLAEYSFSLSPVVTNYESLRGEEDAFASDLNRKVFTWKKTGSTPVEMFPSSILKPKQQAGWFQSGVIVQTVLQSFQRLGWLPGIQDPSTFAFAPHGTYDVRLFVKGRWKWVTVDDRVPLLLHPDNQVLGKCEDVSPPQSPQPCVKRPVPLLSASRMTALLLSKAIVKESGGYDSMPVRPPTRSDFAFMVAQVLAGSDNKGEADKEEEINWGRWRWNVASKGDGDSEKQAIFDRLTLPEGKQAVERFKQCERVSAPTWCVPKFWSGNSPILQQNAPIGRRSYFDVQQCGLFYGRVERIQRVVLKYWQGQWKEYVRLNGNSVGEFLRQSAFFFDLPGYARIHIKAILGEDDAAVASPEDKRLIGELKTAFDTEQAYREAEAAKGRADASEGSLSASSREEPPAPTAGAASVAEATTVGVEPPAVSVSAVALAQLFERFFGMIPEPTDVSIPKGDAGLRLQQAVFLYGANFDRSTYLKNWSEDANQAPASKPEGPKANDWEKARLFVWMKELPESERDKRADGGEPGWEWKVVRRVLDLLLKKSIEKREMVSGDKGKVAKAFEDQGQGGQKEWNPVAVEPYHPSEGSMLAKSVFEWPEEGKEEDLGDRLSGCMFFQMQMRLRAGRPPLNGRPVKDEFGILEEKPHLLTSSIGGFPYVLDQHMDPKEWAKWYPTLELVTPRHVYGIAAAEILAFPITEDPAEKRFFLVYAIAQHAPGDGSTFVWTGRSRHEVSAKDVAVIVNQGDVVKSEDVVKYATGAKAGDGGLQVLEPFADDYACEELFRVKEGQDKEACRKETPVGKAPGGMLVEHVLLPERLLHLLNMIPGRQITPGQEPTPRQKSARKRLLNRKIYRLRTDCGLRKRPVALETGTRRLHDFAKFEELTEEEQTACLEKFEDDPVASQRGESRFWMPWETFVDAGVDFRLYKDPADMAKTFLDEGKYKLHHEVAMFELPSWEYVNRQLALRVNPQGDADAEDEVDDVVEVKLLAEAVASASAKQFALAQATAAATTESNVVRSKTAPEFQKCMSKKPSEEGAGGGGDAAKDREYGSLCDVLIQEEKCVQDVLGTKDDSQKLLTRPTKNLDVRFRSQLPNVFQYTVNVQGQVKTLALDTATAFLFYYTDARGPLTVTRRGVTEALGHPASVTKEGEKCLQRPQHLRFDNVVADPSSLMVARDEVAASESSESVSAGDEDVRYLQAGDIVQENFGNCYLYAALQNFARLGWLTEIPAESPVGLYKVRMFVDGLWRDIVVDDRVPSKPVQRMIRPGGATVKSEPRCLCQSQQPFAPVAIHLLIKAASKIVGNYDHLVGGQVGPTSRALTGADRPIRFKSWSWLSAAMVGQASSSTWLYKGGCGAYAVNFNTQGYEECARKSNEDQLADPRLCELWVSPVTRVQWLLLKAVKRKWKWFQRFRVTPGGGNWLGFTEHTWGLSSINFLPKDALEAIQVILERPASREGAGTISIEHAALLRATKQALSAMAELRKEVEVDQSEVVEAAVPPGSAAAFLQTKAAEGEAVAEETGVGAGAGAGLAKELPTPSITIVALTVLQRKVNGQPPFATPEELEEAGKKMLADLKSHENDDYYMDFLLKGRHFTVMHPATIKPEQKDETENIVNAAKCGFYRLRSRLQDLYAGLGEDDEEEKASEEMAVAGGGADVANGAGSAEVPAAEAGSSFLSGVGTLSLITKPHGGEKFHLPEVATLVRASSFLYAGEGGGEVVSADADGTSPQGPPQPMVTADAAAEPKSKKNFIPPRFKAAHLLDFSFSSPIGEQFEGSAVAGLIPGHAYSIEAVEVFAVPEFFGDPGSSGSGTTAKFTVMYAVKLRNPHGNIHSVWNPFHVTHKVLVDPKDPNAGKKDLEYPKWPEPTFAEDAVKKIVKKSADGRDQFVFDTTIACAATPIWADPGVGQAEAKQVPCSSADFVFHALNSARIHLTSQEFGEEIGLSVLHFGNKETAAAAISKKFGGKATEDFRDKLLKDGPLYTIDPNCNGALLTEPAAPVPLASRAAKDIYFDSHTISLTEVERKECLREYTMKANAFDHAQSFFWVPWRSFTQAAGRTQELRAQGADAKKMQITDYRLPPFDYLERNQALRVVPLANIQGDVYTEGYAHQVHSKRDEMIKAEDERIARAAGRNVIPGTWKFEALRAPALRAPLRKVMRSGSGGLELEADPLLHNRVSMGVNGAVFSPAASLRRPSASARVVADVLKFINIKSAEASYVVQKVSRTLSLQKTQSAVLASYPGFDPGPDVTGNGLRRVLRSLSEKLDSERLDDSPWATVFLVAAAFGIAEGVLVFLLLFTRQCGKICGGGSGRASAQGSSSGRDSTNRRSSRDRSRDSERRSSRRDSGRRDSGRRSSRR